MLQRRGLLVGAGATLTMPAIVRASSLMLIKMPKRDKYIFIPDYIFLNKIPSGINFISEKELKNLVSGEFEWLWLK